MSDFIAYVAEILNQILLLNIADEQFGMIVAFVVIVCDCVSVIIADALTGIVPLAPLNLISAWHTCVWTLQFSIVANSGVGIIKMFHEHRLIWNENEDDNKNSWQDSSSPVLTFYN